MTSLNDCRPVALSPNTTKCFERTGTDMTHIKVSFLDTVNPLQVAYCQNPNLCSSPPQTLRQAPHTWTDTLTQELGAEPSHRHRSPSLHIQLKNYKHWDTTGLCAESTPPPGDLVS